MLFFFAQEADFCNTGIAFRQLVARLSGISKPRRHPQPERTAAKSDGSKVQVSPVLFVCIFTPVFERVFRGRKISGLLFKISGSDFKIRATNFFLAPMRNSCVEN